MTAYIVRKAREGRRGVRAGDRLFARLDKAALHIEPDIRKASSWPTRDHAQGVLDRLPWGTTGWHVYETQDGDGP